MTTVARILRAFPLVAALGPMAGSALAQVVPTALRGVVVDTAGTPIPLAQVILIGVRHPGQVARTETNPRGEFTMSDLPPGSYTVTVRRIGYVPLRTALTMEDGTPRRVVFQLSPMPQRLQDLVVEVADAPGKDVGERAPLFRGLVVDSAGHGIPGAEIVIGGTTVRTRAPAARTTGASGGFVFPVLRPGSYFVTVRRIGYLPIRTTLAFEENHPRTLRFILYQRPTGLPDVVVEAMGMDMRRVTRRISANEGVLLTRDDLQRLAPTVLGDAVGLHLIGVQPDTFNEPSLGFGQPRIRDVSYGLGPKNKAVRKTEQYRGEDCPPIISVNGAPPRLGWAVNDFDPNDVEGIEIYRRRDRIPYAFSIFEIVRRSCGSLIVIWLKPGRVLAPPSP